MANNFAKPLQEATDEELMLWVNTLNPNFTVLCSEELSRREIRKLTVVLEKTDEQNKKLENSNFRLQQAMLVLTAVTTLVAVYPALKEALNWLILSLQNVHIEPIISSKDVNPIAALLSLVVSALVVTLSSYLQTKGIIGNRARHPNNSKSAA